MKNNMKFYEIETKTFFFDEKCSYNVEKGGFFFCVLTNAKRDNPQSAYFLWKYSVIIVHNQ
mgnify:CR=1 FL=1